MQLWQNNPQLGGTDRIQPGQMLVLSYGNKLGRFAVNGYAYPSIDLRVLRRTLPYLTYLSVFSVGFDNTGRILPFSARAARLRMARQYQVKAFARADNTRRGRAVLRRTRPPAAEHPDGSRG